MQSTITKINQWVTSKAGFPLYALILGLTMFLAYDLLITRMGFNYDDWEGIFLHQQGFSTQQIWDYFLIDRPFSSLVHWLFHPILGTSVIGWHLLVLLLHWSAILLLVKSILALFPTQIMAAGWIGLLLGVYPGISRHFVARTSSPHYVSMFLFALSLWLMIQAVKTEKTKWGWLGISTLLALAQSLIIEYFAALEIVRFFVLFYLFHKQLNGQWQKSIQRAFTTWLPYFAVFLVFIYFKFLVLPGLAQTEGLASKHEVALFEALQTAPWQTITAYLNLILQDLIYVVFYVWSMPIDPAEVDVASRSYLASWILGGGVGLVNAIMMLGWYRKEKPTSLSQPTSMSIAAVGLSLAFMLLGGLPAWLIGRQGLTGLWSSRFFLGQILGAVPLVVLMVLAITGKTRQRAANLVLAILLAISFSAQFREANRYTLYWNYQREYYWQLKWRAPGLADQTFILSPYTPLLRNSDYQIAYAINLIYAPGYPNTATKHWWFDGPDSLRDFETKQYNPNRSIQAAMRNIHFDSKMSMALPILNRSSRGCLQVLTDSYYQGEPGLSFEENQLFGLGDPTLVLQNGQPMPTNVFGSEPEHNWCYYYQKAELARQFNDWDKVLSLLDSAVEKQLVPNYGPEYLPFIDALVRTNDWAKAARITIKASRITKDSRPFLCALWQTRFSPLPAPNEREPEWQLIKKELSCE
jgi:hypothetical protein